MSGRSSDLPAPTDRVGLVGCVKSKLTHPAPAADLYVSPLFRGRRAFVDRSCGRWFILSALYGVARPDVVLVPYGAIFNDASRAERRTWAERGLQRLEVLKQNPPNFTFIFASGASPVSGSRCGTRLEGGRDADIRLSPGRGR
jgi:hypothetical protein